MYDNLAGALSREAIAINQCVQDIEAAALLSGMSSELLNRLRRDARRLSAVLQLLSQMLTSPNFNGNDSQRGGLPWRQKLEDE
jgi:hypothetical protein